MSIAIMIEATTASSSLVQGCDLCGSDHDTDDCPSLQQSVHVQDSTAPSRARLTLPANLALKTLPDARCTVVAREKIPAGTQFGPFEAIKSADYVHSTGFQLKVFEKDGRFTELHSDDEANCNWMCFVAVAENVDEQNLIAYQLQHDIYFRTKRDIKIREELRVWYAPHYGRKLGAEPLPPKCPIEICSDPNAEDALVPPKRKPGRPRKDQCKVVSVPKPSPPIEVVVEDEVQTRTGRRRKLRTYTDYIYYEKTAAKKMKPAREQSPEQDEFHQILEELAKDDPSPEGSEEDSYSGSDVREKKRGRRSRRIPSDPEYVEERPFFKIEEPNEGDSVEVITLEKEKAYSPEDVVSSFDLKQLGFKTMQAWACSQCGELYQDCIQFAYHLKDHYRPRGNLQLKTLRQKFAAGRRRRFQCKFCTSKFREQAIATWFKMIALICNSSPKLLHRHRLNQHVKVLRSLKSKIVSPDKGPSDVKVEETREVNLEVHAASEMSDRPEGISHISDADAASILLQMEANTEKTEGGNVIVQENASATSDDKESLKNSIIGCGIEPSLVASHTIVAEENQSDGIFTEGLEGTDGDGAKKVISPFHGIPRIRKGKFSCDICKKRFEKSIYLFRHISKHTGDFTCSKCHKVFARRENLLKHSCLVGVPSDGMTDTVAHTCNFCHKAFGTDRLLKRHISKHTGDYTCQECGKSYTCKEILNNHVCTKKPAVARFTCEICRKTFTKLKYLDKHIPVHTGAHTCPICGKWLRSHDSLINHMRICGQVNELESNGSATCPNCKMEFTDVRAFRRHLYEHTHVFTCASCGARFRNKVSLGLHVCDAKRPLRCRDCGREFLSIASFNRHKATHTDTPMRCSRCKQQFDTKEQMTAHVCDKRRGVRGARGPRKLPNLMPLICEICGSMFSSTSSLNVHKNLHGEKKFRCDTCGKRFHRKDLMLEHLAVHSAPAVPCPVCNKMFKTKKSLDVHLLIHDGTKRFSCAVCGKQFYQKGNLLKHEDTHTPGRKYACQYCNKAFGTKEYLAIHVLEHTRGRIYQCESCDKNFVKEHQLKAHQRIFHSNLAYVCKYCGLTVKLRHSLKRHLEKKHFNERGEWEANTTLKDMLVVQSDSPSTATLQVENEVIVNEISSMQGAEVLLAVAGIDSATLHQALAAGTARIQQGATPDTIEISLPMDDDALAEALMSNAVRDEGAGIQTRIIQVPMDVDGNTVLPTGKDVTDVDNQQIHIAVNQCEDGSAPQFTVVSGEAVDADGELKTIVLENGTYLQSDENPDNPTNVLLYVLTTTDDQDPSLE